MPENITVPISNIDVEPMNIPAGFRRAVEERGVQENVVLEAIGDRFQIIDGKRRVLSATERGDEHIVALVYTEGELTPDERALLSLTLNLNRGSNAAMEAKCIQELKELGYTQGQIARRVGVTQAQISMRERLLKLIPSFFEKLQRGDINITSARELAMLSQEVQEEYENRDNLTLAEIKERKRLETVGRLELDTIETPRLEHIETHNEVITIPKELAVEMVAAIDGLIGHLDGEDNVSTASLVRFKEIVGATE